MAVVLDREGRAPTPNPANLPRVTVKNVPVLSPEHLHKGLVTGRTQTVYTCDEPDRQTLWKENYDRRQNQLSFGGFHTSPAQKYQEIGQVVLDDKTLILQGLRQTHLETEQIVQSNDDKQDTVVSKGDHNLKCPKLRARTKSQFPNDLLDLHCELDRANLQLNEMRMGHGLFDMFKKDELQKEMEIQKINKKQIEAKLNEWQPGIVIDIDSSESIEQSNESEMLAMTQISFTADGTTNEEKYIEDNNDHVTFTYYKLSTIVWILECIKLQSPHHMMSLHSFWHINRRPVVINEANGRRVYDRNVTLLKKYEHIVSENKSSEELIHNPTTAVHQQQRPSSKLERMKLDEMKLRKQRRLTAEQMEKLKKMIDEELNHISKRAKKPIKELEQEKQKSQFAAVNVKLPKISKPSTLNLDPAKTAASNFEKINENRNMLVHEQLTVMNRECKEAMQQRFSSLEISQNMWEDLIHMREGVQIETTTMARNKLMMNYNWYEELKSNLSEEILTDQNCQEIMLQLESLQIYMRHVGPQKMSKRKLINVLSLFRPWELRSPTIYSAVEFITRNVIYIVPEDYEAWLQYHSAKS